MKNYAKGNGRSKRDQREKAEYSQFSYIPILLPVYISEFCLFVLCCLT